MMWRPERSISPRGGDPVQLLRKACASIGAEISAEQAQAALAARRDLLFHRSFRARDGALTTLRHLRARRIRTALVSNCGLDVPDLFAQSELVRYFDAAVF